MSKAGIIASIMILLSFLACKKSESDDQVLIRVENATPDNFSTFSLNATQFGPINSGQTTSYYICQKVWPVPFANEIGINGRGLYYVDIVPTPFLKKGHYLMRLVPDSTVYQYNATFVTE